MASKPDGLRILVDGTSLLGQKTGIGWYTHRLVEALSQRDDVAEVGVMLGTRVVKLHEVDDPPPEPTAATPPIPTRRQRYWSHFRRFVRDRVPYARDLVMLSRKVRMRRAAPGWKLFHQPNYVSPDVTLPLVTTVCDMSYITCPQWMPHERWLWLNRSLEKCLERSRAIVTISDFTRDEMLSHLPHLDPQRVFVTHLGVDHERFHAATDETDGTLHARLKLPRQFVLYLGTLEPRKNLQGLLAAFAQLPRSLQREYPLVLAGAAGWKEQYFESHLQELKSAGVVHSLGYVAQDDIPALLRAATVFAFPSYYEGFGLPVLEAAACGTPVLCSNTSSMPEVMGEAAMYVDPRQPDDIAAKLMLLLDDEAARRELAAAGRERSRAFSWQNCAAETVRAYRAAA
jgi:alpha-1,3-rhamnosyl/mannosyltransferase